MDIIENNKKVYNMIASLFSQTRTYLWDDLKPLGKYTKDGDHVLDLGCGNGRLYQLFSDLSIKYVGVDQSEGLIQIAKEKAPDLQFEVAQMQDLPFEDQSFDIIYCIAAFHHLPDVQSRQKALKEMYRVLKPAGTVVMTNWNLNAPKAKRKAQEWEKVGDNGYMVPWKSSEGKALGFRYYYGFDMEELDDLIEKTGFKIMEHYFTRKGRKDGTTGSGNIVHVAKKKTA